MMKDKIRDRLYECVTHLLFDYKGKAGGVDPLARDKEYDMWYGDDSITVDSLDKAMKTKFFDGKSLEEISDEIENVEGL